jgi:trehalose 6-phosphate phosphatase
VRALVARSEVTHALYAGDDVTDLDAFTALRALCREGVLAHCLCVGVASEDGPAAIREQADVVVDGTSGMQDVLAALTAGE